MITESLFNSLFSGLRGLFGILPDISWEVNPEVFDAFFQIIRLAGYLLPMGTVITILGIILAFNAFKIVISLIKTIWALFPFT